MPLRPHVLVLVAVLTLGGLGAAATTPGNDAFASAAPLTLLPEHHEIRSTSGATLEEGEPTPCGRMDATVWYRLELSGGGAGWVDVDTRGSDYDTSLAVYAGEELGNLTLVECNDDTSGYGLASRVIFFADPGTVYHVQAGGYLGATGMMQLNAVHTWGHPCDSGPLADACP